MLRLRLMGGVLALACLPCQASKRKPVPSAPLPAAVTSAKKVFLTNAGGSQLAFDEFYSQVKQWGRYQIVGFPSEADIVLELRYAVQNDGTRVWSATNTYTGQTNVYSRQVVDPQPTLNIYDGRSKFLLWSTTDHARLARLEKNREKETVKSADRLVENLVDRAAEGD